MKHRLNAWAAAGLAAGALCCARPGDAAKAIEEANARYMQAYNRGDAAAAAGFFTEDVRMLLPGSPMLTGRAAVEKALKDQIAAGARYSQLHVVEVAQSGDMAVEVGTYALALQPAGGPAGVETGKYADVWRRQSDGTWQMAMDISNTDAAEPAR